MSKYSAAGARLAAGTGGASDGGGSGGHGGQGYRGGSARATGGARDSEKLSRSLTSLLRHNAAARGIAMDSGGLCLLDDVLRLPDFRGATLADVERVVRECKKQRFRLVRRDDGRMLIGATQGHTIPTVDPLSLMEPLTVARAADFPVVVHGTHHAVWPSIAAQGLSPMGRQHVHLATGYSHEGGVVSGMRRSAEVIVYVDVIAAIREGIPFFLSQNGVILTPGDASGYLPPRFFARVLNVRTGRPLDGYCSRGASAAPAPASHAVVLAARGEGGGGGAAAAAAAHGDDGRLESVAPVDYLAVLDFEATCKEGGEPSPQVCSASRPVSKRKNPSE